MTVCVVARQAGTAAAFAPVIGALKQRVPATPVFAYERAAEVLHAAGVQEFTVVHQADDGIAAATKASPDALLTGTSLAVEDDARWWSWARDNAVSSVGFVDQWVNYWQRFTLPGGQRFGVTPDMVAVVDERARERLSGAGCPVPIVVTGTPVVDELARPTDDDIAATRTALLGSSPGPLVLYASEPDGDAALDAVLDAAASVAERHPLTLAVRRHPVEGPTVLPPSPAPGVRIVDGGGQGDRATLLLAADLVVGLRSVLLYEATVAGIPAVSVELACNQPSDAAARPGIVTVQDATQLAKAIERGLATERAPRPAIQPGAATKAFLDQLGLS